MSVPASLSLEEATQREWPIVVAGAGPAGAFAARGLALAGAKVLLVDRAAFPRWKVCGCCLNGAALGVLNAAGLGSLVFQCRAVPLTGVKLGADGCSATLTLSSGVALSRELFDLALVNAAIEAGATFLPETAARLLPCAEPGNRRIRLRQAGREAVVRARITVVADGLTGQVLADEPGHRVRVDMGAWIGAGTVLDGGPPSILPGIIYMACGAGGYVGLVRLEDGRLDLAAALNPGHVRRVGSLADAAATILASASGLTLHDLQGSTWRGTPALTRQVVLPAGERYFVLGDAAGYVEPFTGEGMAWALASAAGLAPLVLRGLDNWSPRFASLWRRRLRQLLSARRLACLVLTRLLRRPRLTASLVRILRYFPIFARPLLALLDRPLFGANVPIVVD